MFKQRLKDNNGSVQDEDWLTPQEKAVFRCFWEMNQRDVIAVAAARQPFLDQAQSLNLLYTDNNGRKISDDLIYAHDEGLACVYYHRGMNPSQMLLKAKKPVVIEERKEENTQQLCRV